MPKNSNTAGRTYDFGCLMLQVQAASIPHFISLLAAIKPADLYESDVPGEFGLEYDPHVTVLFGFHDDASGTYPTRVMKTAKQFIKTPAIPLTLAGISLFSQEKYDVLKFDVTSSKLTMLNKEVAKRFDHTNEYKYHPHLTLAYVQPGKGEEYAKKLWELAGGKPIKLGGTRLMYSRPSGEKLYSPL